MEVDMDLRLKKEENGEEIDVVPVEWRLAGLQGQIMSIQMETKESISSEEMKVQIKFKQRCQFVSNVSGQCLTTEKLEQNFQYLINKQGKSLSETKNC